MSDVEAVKTTGDSSLFFAPTTIKNCVLNWLVPGLGYFLVGRKKAGIMIMSALFLGLLFGVLLGGDLFPFVGEGKLRGAGAICQMGMGLPYFLSKLIFTRGTPLDISYDYGTSYLLIVGMLNWLGVIDIFDISVKRK